MNSRQQLVAVEALERRLLEPGVRSSREKIEELLAEDFVEIGSSGRMWTKAEIIAELLAQPSPEIEIDSVDSRHIGEDVVLLTYRSRRPDVTGHNEALRSSLWRRTGDGWQLVFHQGTKA
jgi:hypothetical protein